MTDNQFSQEVERTSALEEDDSTSLDQQPRVHIVNASLTSEQLEEEFMRDVVRFGYCENVTEYDIE